MWAINAVSELYNDSSWDQTREDSLWSWDSWDSWDPWGWSSDFTSDIWATEATPAAKAETLAKPLRKRLLRPVARQLCPCQL